MRCLRLACGLLRWSLALGCCGLLTATDPPTKEMLARYRADGSLARRVEAYRATGNHRPDPDLAARVSWRLQRLAEATQPSGRGPSLEQAPPPGRGLVLPSKGKTKILVLLIDFPDYPATETADVIRTRIFGNGTSAPPYESLTAYYQRASYGQLTIEGHVLGWYRHPGNRATIPETSSGRAEVIKQAVSYFKQQGHDFSQYDNDGDGVIETVVAMWTGPDNGWSNFWWASNFPSFPDSSFRVDGKALRRHIWQYVSNPWPGAYSPRTLIHEVGHSLGLPDLYDTVDGNSNLGGVGGLDMMDGDWGDHNAFSKFMLEWMTPRVVTGATQGITLRPLSEAGDAVLMWPEPPSGGTFGEFFIVENRQKTLNDSTHPGSGLLIWHVDSALNSSSAFQCDNNSTAHKYLRLMEADGLEEIDRDLRANAGDYWNAGAHFSPYSTPNSNRYPGTVPTLLGVTNISAPAGGSATFDVTVAPTDPTDPVGTPTAPIFVQRTNYLDGVLSWTPGTAADPDSGTVAYHLQLGTKEGSGDLLDTVMGGGFQVPLSGLIENQPLFARVRAVNGGGRFSAWSTGTVFKAGLEAIPDAVLDCPMRRFVRYGDYPWVADSSRAVEGGSSLLNAAVPHSGTAYVMTYVEGPAVVGWSWSVSSQADDKDYLYVALDGTIPSGCKLSGEKPMARKTLEVGAGRHLVRWGYRKDASISEGADAGWLDKVTVRSRDLRADGAVDVLDLAAMLRAWTGAGVPASHPAADLDGDGDVDDDDLNLFLAGW